MFGLYLFNLKKAKRYEKKVYLMDNNSTNVNKMSNNVSLLSDGLVWEIPFLIRSLNADLYTILHAEIWSKRVFPIRFMAT